MKRMTAINQLTTILQKGEISSEIIKKLIKLLEITDANDIEDNIRQDILVPFIKKLIIGYPELRDLLFKFFEAQIERRNVAVVEFLLTTVISNLDQVEFKTFFGGCMQELFEILYNLDEVSLFDLIWNQDFANQVGETFTPFIRENIIRALENNNYNKFLTYYFKFSYSELFHKDDKLLQAKIQNVKITPEIIKALVESFKENHFTDFYSDKEDPLAPVRLRITDEGLKNNIIMPLIKKTMTNDLKYKKLFFDEIERHEVESTLFEIILSNLDETEFKSYFGDSLQRFFNILHKIVNSRYDTDFWYDLFLKPIGKSISPFLRQKILKIIEKKEIVELITLYHAYNYFEPLNEQDAIFLFKETNLVEFLFTNFANENSVDNNPDLKDIFYEFGLHFSKEIDNWIKPYITKNLRSIITKRDYKLNRALVHLDFIRFLDEEERKALFIDYDYTLFVHWKQGDDLAYHIEDQKGDAVKALLSWANELEGSAKLLERLVNMFKGKNLEVIDAQVHHISLGGDMETLELAVKENLLSKDKIDIYYD